MTGKGDAGGDTKGDKGTPRNVYQGSLSLLLGWKGSHVIEKMPRSRSRINAS